MIISIDGQALQDSLVTGENLEEILVNLQEHHLPTDRMVGDVLINGRSYSEDVPHAAVEVDRSQISTLELVTRTPEEIASHFINHGGQLLNLLLDALPHITDMFRMGDETEANEHFLRFVESLHLMLTMLDQAGSFLNIGFESAIGEHGSVDDRLHNLASTFSRLIEIQENSDWIYLADILEYELTPELETLALVMAGLRSQAH